MENLFQLSEVSKKAATGAPTPSGAGADGPLWSNPMSSVMPRWERLVLPPLHPFLACLVAACLVSALLTDIAYASTALIMWADFSAWLISAGTVLAWLFVVVGIVELALRPAMRHRQGMLPYALGNLVVLVLATFNMLVHTRDAWTSVVPTGLALSVVTTLAVFVTAWLAIPLVSTFGTEVVSP